MKQKYSAWKDAISLMRIPFSVYLMPVFWFAMSNTNEFDIQTAIIVFVILHLFVYPASNGYNSYYDRDTGSIGGLKTPPQPNKELLVLVNLFDLIAALLSFLLVSPVFALMVIVYLLVSKAYSFDKIRLKKYPVMGAVVVTVFQGAFIYLAVKFAIQDFYPFDFAYALVSSLFLAGSYPLTQVYQHEEDRKHGDETLSLKLGIQGTFTFAKLFIAAGSVLLLLIYFYESRFTALLIFPSASLPGLIYFNNWGKKVKRNLKEADYENTMKMNKISSLCLSIAFILISMIEKN